MIRRNNIRVSYFESFDDIQSKVDEWEKTIGSNNPEYSSESFVRSSINWLELNPQLVQATPNIMDLVDPKNMIRFVNEPVLQQSVQVADSLRDVIDFGGVTEKSKLVTTSLPMGIFDFNLAAKGLYRPVEFYDMENDKLADEDFVVKFDSVTWIDSKATNPTPLRRQQKGTFELMQMAKKYNIPVDLIEVNDNLFAPRPISITLPSGEKKKVVFRTNNKRNYIYRKNEGGKAKYVDLFLLCGGNYDASSENMFVKNIPLILAAQSFERAGIKTRILGFDVSFSNINSDKYTRCWVIKDYGEATDFNQLAIQSSDPRLFRVFLFRAEAVISRAIGNNIMSADNTGVPNLLDSTAREYFENVKMFLLNESRAGRYKSKVQDKALMMTGGISAGRTFSTITTDELLNEYYQIIDIAQVILSKQKYKSVKRIVDRLKSQGKNEQQIRRYFSEIMQRAFFEVPQDKAGDPYGMTRDELQNLRERRDEITELLITALK